MRYTTPSYPRLAPQSPPDSPPNSPSESPADFETIPFPLAPAGTPSSFRDDPSSLGRWHRSAAGKAPGRDADQASRLLRDARTSDIKASDPTAITRLAEQQIQDAQKSLDELSHSTDGLAPFPFNAFGSESPEPPRAA
ncbi:MAG: hypothetical protein AAF235_07600 [Planctomycetota bacterium]